jgi:hypothetical protein
MCLRILLFYLEYTGQQIVYAGLCRWYISITILDSIHRPVLYLKHRVLETGFCLHLQMEATQFGATDKASLGQNSHLMAKTDPVSETSCFLIKWNRMDNVRIVVVMVTCSPPRPKHMFANKFSADTNIHMHPKNPSPHKKWSSLITMKIIGHTLEGSSIVSLFNLLMWLQLLTDGDTY